MRNARAAWKDQLRNQVRAGQPDLSDAEVDDRVAELISAARSAAGRKGAAQVRRSALAAQNVLESRAFLEGLARDLLSAIESLADPTADCLHDFATGKAGDYCRRCGAEVLVETVGVAA